MIRDNTSEGPQPSGAHIIKLRNHVDNLQNWIGALPEEVQASITSRWSEVDKFKGFAGTSWSWPSFSYMVAHLDRSFR